MMTEAGEFPPFSSYEAKQIVPASVIIPGEGARIRLVGGADLSAANTLATVNSSTGGDVVIGNPNADVMVRTTTGSIDMAAGRDLSFTNRRAVVYTTGEVASDSALARYAGNRLIPEAYLNVGETSQTPFLSGGGSIGVRAARDVLGATGSRPQYATEWLWATGDIRRDGGLPTWYGRYDYFNQGIATFGGGNVSVQAGRDARNVEVSAATSGYVPVDASGSRIGREVFGGGDVTLVAQRDVVAGFALAGQGTQRVVAGRDVRADATEPALQLVVGETAATVEARNSLDLGRVTPFGLVGTTSQFATAQSAIAVTGTAPGSSLLAQADSGDLVYRAKAPVATAQVHEEVDGAQGNVIPDFATFAAPVGSVQLAALIQTPADDGALNVLAGKDVSTFNVTVTATSAAAKTLTLAEPLAPLLQAFPQGGTPLDSSGRSPVRIVAEEGDIAYSGAIQVVRPIRVIAGRDIAGSGTASSIKAQHQADDELSLIEAGRDIALPPYARNTTDLRVLGPGDLVVLAGRNVDFKASGGIGAVGNRENSALPDGSAAITVLAGVSPRGRDGTQATAWYFPLLGGTGIAAYAADLAAQLGALAAGQPIPALGSAAASSFKALPIDQQAAAARGLCGDASFDATLLTSMRRIEANPSLDLAGANAAFAKLGAAAQSGVVGAALADAWSARLGADEQHRQALAMASAQDAAGHRVDALTAFTSGVVGRNLTPAQALEAFAALPVERRLVFTNRVLADEVRSAGRAASSLAGEERDAAYAKAYAAIDTVFPEVGGSGNVLMGSSQIRTFQGSDITVTTPRGGINVGELSASSSSKDASALGIVTAAGGDISLIVKDSVAVNQSRVFTVGKGDLLMWASEGNLDAGRGAKTVTGAPPPVFRFDENGNFVVDTSGSFSGSGIAVLDAGSTLDLYAPKGEINAGDAGIKSLGNAFLGAARFVGADNLSIGGVAVGAPPPAPTGGDTAGLAAVGQAATSAGTRINPDDSEEEKERKRRKRLNLILDFLGFGDGSATKP
jgi:Filamentous haemagglutinin family outer membrane protein